MRLTEKQCEEAGMWLYVHLQEMDWQPPPEEEREEWLWYHPPTQKHLGEWYEMPKEQQEKYINLAVSTAEELFSHHSFRLRCGYCGAFVPFGKAHTEYDWWSGASGSAWECDRCGRVTSEL